MLKSRHKSMLVALALGLTFVLALLYSTSPRSPRLTLTYLSRTNDSTRTIVQFAITNVGSAAAISFPQGRVEMSGLDIVVACRPKLHRLSPGQGDVIQVFLPQGLQGRWRFTCLYAREGIRSRISDWQWRAGGPGPRANRFIPSFLKGVPLDVNATSNWIEE